MDGEWLEGVRQVWEEYRTDKYSQVSSIRETAQVRNGLRNIVDELVETAIQAETARASNHCMSAKVYRGLPYDAGLFDVVRYQAMTQDHFLNRKHAMQAATQALSDEITSDRGSVMLFNLSTTLCEQLEKLENNWKWWKKLQQEASSNFF